MSTRTRRGPEREPPKKRFRALKYGYGERPVEELPTQVPSPGSSMSQQALQSLFSLLEFIREHPAPETEELSSVTRDFVRRPDLMVESSAEGLPGAIEAKHPWITYDRQRRYKLDVDVPYARGGGATLRENQMAAYDAISYAARLTNEQTCRCQLGRGKQDPDRWEIQTGGLREESEETLRELKELRERKTPAAALPFVARPVSVT